MHYQLHSHGYMAMIYLSHMELQSDYEVMKGGRELYLLHFDEKRETGYVSYVERYEPNRREEQINIGKIHFIRKGNYFLFLTPLFSIKKFKFLFDYVYKYSDFYLLKHPLFKNISDCHEVIEFFIRFDMPDEEIAFLEIDKYEGFKMMFGEEKRKKFLGYNRKGMITFGMRKNRTYIEKIMEFIISFHTRAEEYIKNNHHEKNRKLIKLN